MGIRLLPILWLVFAAACGPAGQAQGNVYLDSTEIVLRESYPVQAALVIRGSLPTPCHELKVEVSPPDGQNRILVNVYSVSDPDQVCIQVLEPFEETAELGSFTQGTYGVWVNGEAVGKIDL